MGFSGFIRGVVLILMASSFVRPLMADPRANVVVLACNSWKAVNATILATNAVIALVNLSSLVDQNGFGAVVASEGPNAVFGVAQCYKDLSFTDCKLCYSEIQTTIAKCFPKMGRIFLDGCFARSENYSFFNQGIDSVNFKNCSLNKNYQPDKFKEVIRKVIGSVSLASKRSKGFAVGSDSISNLRVYALAQCWETLDEKACDSCLQAATSSIMSCSPSVEGRSLHAGCYMRYSTQLFWNLNQTTTHSSGTHKSLPIILGSALVGFLALTLIGFWKAKGYLGRSYCKSLNDSYGSGLSISTYLSKLNFRYKELRRATNNFDSLNKLGQGSYGSVYKGVLTDGREVAVKRLFLNTRQWVDQFFNEVNLISQVRHKNLVKLLGCSVDGPESLLVYKYYFNKSLDHFIFDENQAKLLDWQKRIDIIQGVAEGLCYLHEESEIRIIHRDIKASNILLDNKFEPKITDFGLARSFTEDQTHLSTGIAGTLGYMSPEYVVHGHLTEKADIYSFGVLVLEIMTGQRCNNGLGAKPGLNFLAKIWSHYKAKKIGKIIDRSFYEDAMEDDMLHVVHVALLCTQATPCFRPTMAKVVELLRSCKDKIVVFPTEPPFLDVAALEILEVGEGSHLLSPPSFSGSSGNLFYR